LISINPKIREMASACCQPHFKRRRIDRHRPASGRYGNRLVLTIRTHLHNEPTRVHDAGVRQIDRNGIRFDLLDKRRHLIRQAGPVPRSPPAIPRPRPARPPGAGI
jgi:hypothetical protein